MPARHATTLSQTRSTRVLLAACLIGGLGACSTMRPAGPVRVPPPPPPPPAALEPHSTTTALSAPPSAGVPKGCADEKCLARVQARHRQYFDMRRKRYYFYDPAKRAYFWEDGSPKS